MTLIKPLVLCFLLNVHVEWLFIFFINFLFCNYFFFGRSITVLLSLGGNFDQHRSRIDLFNSFRVIKCSAYFWASVFHYCLKFLMFFILPFFKYVSFSSVNLVAAEFHFLHAV